MLHWLYYYITSEPPAWINYSSPCHNTKDALIMTDSQTRLCSKWQRENSHESPLSLWLRHVTAKREIQIRRASSLRSKTAKVLDANTALCSCGVITCRLHTVECRSISMGFTRSCGHSRADWGRQLCFLLCPKCFRRVSSLKPHQGRWRWLTAAVGTKVKQLSTSWFMCQDNRPWTSVLDNLSHDPESEKEWNNDEL